MNVEGLRKDFPILKKGIIYLDSAATSLTPEPVLESMLNFYREYNANVERGIHRLSQLASQMYEDAHSKVADFIGAGEGEVIFTKNTTEAINLVASGMGLKRGEKIVSTIAEHHSNLLPWMRAKKSGVRLELVKPGKNGSFSPESFRKAVDSSTKLVAIFHVSNVFGSIMQVEEIAEICKENGAMLLLDGAQSVPHLKVDVKKLGCDFLAFSGHKMLAPKGTGVLWIRKEIINEIEPLSLGGGTIKEVSINGYTLTDPWERFEAGTPNIGGGIALGKAVEYLREIGMEKIRGHEEKLTRKLLEGLLEIKNVEVYGPLERKQRTGVVSFNIKGLNPHDVALMLDEAASIMVRSGHHCCMPLMRFLGTDGTVRASLYLYNTEEEIEKLLSIVEEISRSLA